MEVKIAQLVGLRLKMTSFERGWRLMLRFWPGHLAVRLIINNSNTSSSHLPPLCGTFQQTGMFTFFIIFASDGSLAVNALQADIVILGPER